MSFFQINYLNEYENHITVFDYESKDKSNIINTDFILSISDIKEFNPFYSERKNSMN